MKERDLAVTATRWYITHSDNRHVNERDPNG
jgi:hypothetical protein